MLHSILRLAALGLLLAWVPFASAAPVKEPKTTTEESPAQKLKKELDVAITVELEMGLAQAIKELGEQAKINIVLDRNTILALGIDPDNQPVTLKGKNIKLRSGLRTMLQQMNLTYAIVGDSILVTTEEMAIYRQFKQRVSMELDKVELKTALKKLATETAVNIVIDPKVAKEAAAAVTLELDEVPLEAAVRLLAEQAGLKAARVGNVIMVTTKDTAKGLKEDGDLAPKPSLYPGAIDGGVVPLLPPGGGGIGGAPAQPAVEEKKD